MKRLSLHSWAVYPKPTEQPLYGGNVADGVVRVGDTVHRPARPWSSSVVALLLHLERAGYEGAPRALGYDQAGRQVLSFVEGFVDPNPSDLDRERLADTGREIRDFHDAVSSFTPPPGSVWNVAIRPDREDLICHHDLAPWNLVRSQSGLVFIDWDGAGPGSRLWDLSYAAHGFVPLSAGSSVTDIEAARRLASLVDGYGLANRDRQKFVALLVPRIRSMYNLLRQGHRSGRQPWRRLWCEGHGAIWLADAEYVEERIGLWNSAVNA